MNDYQRGTKDAWELAKKICLSGYDCYTIEELETIFGTRNIRAIMEATYGETKEKIEKWNNREHNREQYKVGDIIECFGAKAFVTKVDDHAVNYVKANGETGGFIIDPLWLDWEVIGHVRSIVFDTEKGKFV